jgi:hypothetical protein
MTCDRAYHSRRARIERELAYRAADSRVGDAHLRLSALHLSRALLLGELERSYGSQDTLAPVLMEMGRGSL